MPVKSYFACVPKQEEIWLDKALKILDPTMPERTYGDTLQQWLIKILQDELRYKPAVFWFFASFLQFRDSKALTPVAAVQELQNIGITTTVGENREIIEKLAKRAKKIETMVKGTAFKASFIDYGLDRLGNEEADRGDLADAIFLNVYGYSPEDHLTVYYYHPSDLLLPERGTRNEVPQAEPEPVEAEPTQTPAPTAAVMSEAVATGVEKGNEKREVKDNIGLVIGVLGILATAAFAAS